MRLPLPPNNLAAIRQDYRDKHNSNGGGVLLCRKYPPRQVIDKESGQPVIDKAGNPVMWCPWYDGKELTVNETKYVNANHWFSEEKHNDCYATINHFPIEYPPEVFWAMNEGGTYRTSDNLAYLTGFYLDFDHRKIHDVAKNQQAPAELVQEALSYAELIEQTLVDYLPDDYGMPVITYTGGGFGFYFKIRPIPATTENKARHMEIYEKLYRRFSILFAELLNVFENDHKVVGSERVIRVTGTYNSKTGAYAQYIARYGNATTDEVYQYSLSDIYDLYRLNQIKIDVDPAENDKPNACLVKDSPLQKKKREKRGEKEEQGSSQAVQAAPAYAQRGNVAYPTKWYQGWVNAKQLGKYLELSVKSLEYLDSQGALQRNNALFLIACLKTELELAKYGYYILDQSPQIWARNIISYVANINDSLTTPLEEEELDALLNSALTNKYHFRRRDKIQQFLNLTDAEFSSLGWMDKQKKEAQKQERNNVLTDLDKDVVKLYLSGLSDAKIATALGITKRTSINIRQRLGVTDRSAKWENIDFEGNKRHIKHAKAEAPEPAPIFPYMPWYKPTYKSVYVWDYRTNNQVTKNAVVERTQKLAELKDLSYKVSDVKRLSDIAKRAANISDEERNKILAYFEDIKKQAERQYREELWEEFG